MNVRVLTAWPGSPPCGSVADVPDALAAQMIRLGHAEPVAPPARASRIETMTDHTPVDMAVTPAAKPPRRERRR